MKTFREKQLEKELAQIKHTLTIEQNRRRCAETEAEHFRRRLLRMIEKTYRYIEISGGDMNEAIRWFSIQ